MTGRRARKPWRTLGWELTISRKDMDRHNESRPGQLPDTDARLIWLHHPDAF